MTYVIVALVVIIRVFGFRKTINFINGFFSGARTQFHELKSEVSNSALNAGNGKKLLINDAKVARNIASREGNAPWAEVAGSSAISKNTNTKLKSRRIDPRLVQSSGRTSEEILAGKPDFGWRRVY